MRAGTGLPVTNLPAVADAPRSGLAYRASIATRSAREPHRTCGLFSDISISKLHPGIRSACADLPLRRTEAGSLNPEQLAKYLYYINFRSSDTAESCMFDVMYPSAITIRTGVVGWLLLSGRWCC
jgi:hypothetical protein